MPRELRIHNYIKRGTLLCVYGGGKAKTNTCVGVITRIQSYNLIFVILWLAKFKWFSQERTLGINAINNSLIQFGIWPLGKSWCLINRVIGNPICLWLCLDEFTVLLNLQNIFKINYRLRPLNQNIINTNRKCIASISITNLFNLKHHNDIGTCSQPGLEY
ncbi:putative cob(I)alamin adenosyltransferase [Candidatus Hodgkinia cicadicola]|uniref:Cob(I)alamin adenosyltransferase n=1 Tax=Candidatus Hodgkinia cicadicola TaxID=573658 RepID=A0ABX4MGA4_9HYPH|nr:putative cob(I)alamin adenosyltransferase [Candidatus Hodgkinia cicadicola]